MATKLTSIFPDESKGEGMAESERQAEVIVLDAEPELQAGQEAVTANTTAPKVRFPEGRGA